MAPGAYLDENAGNKGAPQIPPKKNLRNFTQKNVLSWKTLQFFKTHIFLQDNPHLLVDVRKPPIMYVTRCLLRSERGDPRERELYLGGICGAPLLNPPPFY